MLAKHPAMYTGQPPRTMNYMAQSVTSELFKDYQSQ